MVMQNGESLNSMFDNTLGIKPDQGNYLITGVTGFLGGLITRQLIQSKKYADGKIHIYGIVRDYEKAKEQFSREDNQYLSFFQADVCNYDMLQTVVNQKIDYIIHCAASTKSSYMISNPVETADGIVMGTHNMLELARQLNVKSMVYVSSMEVYGQVADVGHLRKEEELGEIVLESARSCYSMGKRMAEHYCHIYQQEYNVPVKIARLAQTFGVGTSAKDTRVYMQFAKAAFEGKDIILKTQGDSMGNYCASDEAVEAIFLLLEKGIDGEVYNVVNEENTMTIRDMAELVANTITSGEIRVRIELEDNARTGYAPQTRLKMSGQKLYDLGWKPKKSLVQMYRDIFDNQRKD